MVNISFVTVSSKLIQNYTSLGKVVKETLIVEISGYKYFVHAQNGYGYPSFSLQNEFDGEIISFS